MSEGFEVVSGGLGELFWNVADGVVVARPGQVLAWNPAAEAVTGMAAADALAGGSDLTAAFGDATEAFWRLVQTGSGKECLECRGGSERILETVAWHLGGEGSSPVVVVLRDVTNEWRQMAGLRRLNALARQLLSEPLVDALLVRIVDAAKELGRADFSALLLLRDGSDEEVAHFSYNAPRDLFPARLPRAVGLLAVAIRTREVVRLDDIRGHPAGVGIPVEHPPIAALLAAPVLIGDQVVGELAVANSPDRGVFDDVDEAMITELAAHAALAVSLCRARADRERSQASDRVLMESAVQNIRTPLTVASELLATLREQGADLSAEERDRAFEAVERAHERIHALAEGVALDDPLATGPPRQIEVIAVSELLDELVRDLGGVDPAVRLDVAVEPGAPSRILGDRRLVRELVDNLVTNAIEHSPPGEAVTITARGEGRSLRLDVTDRGPGIAPAEQGKVFEQFYRTPRSVAEGGPGTGLGLWIARRLAEHHGGTVGITSRVGQGCTFWVTFPPLGPPSRTALAVDA